MDEQQGNDSQIEEEQAPGTVASPGAARADAVGVIRVAVLIAAAVILVGSVFIFSSNDDPPGDSTDRQATPAVSDSEETPAEEPAHFVGSIVSDDNGFTIIVAEDGSASGTMNVFQTMEAGVANQSGTFAGSIDAENVIVCAGTFEGMSVDEAGDQMPYDGTVSLRAVPTSADLSTWDIIVDSDPGDAVTVPAHAR